MTTPAERLRNILVLEIGQTLTPPLVEQIVALMYPPPYKPYTPPIPNTGPGGDLNGLTGGAIL